MYAITGYCSCKLNNSFCLLLYGSWFCISKLQHLSMTWEWCTRGGQSIPAVVTKVSNTKLNTISFLPLNVTFLVHSRITPSIVISVLVRSSCSKIQSHYLRSLGSFCQGSNTILQTWPLLIVLQRVFLCLDAFTHTADFAQFIKQCSGVNTP